MITYHYRCQNYFATNKICSVPSVQCAAVTTCWEDINVPPQCFSPFKSRATCHGMEWGLASHPPTISSIMQSVSVDA